MDINKVYLTGTVSAVSYRSQRNSFKLKFSLKTVLGQLRNFRITDSLGKVALTSKVLAREIKLGS